MLKSGLRAASMRTRSAAAILAAAAGTSAATSTGTTTAPWRSAWMRSPGCTDMPCTVTGTANSTTCTHACEGPREPASAPKPGAQSAKSRIDPLVTTPSEPSPEWMLLFTSPHQAP